MCCFLCYSLEIIASMVCTMGFVNDVCDIKTQSIRLLNFIITATLTLSTRLSGHLTSQY